MGEAVRQAVAKAARVRLRQTAAVAAGAVLLAFSGQPPAASASGPQSRAAVSAPEIRERSATGSGAAGMEITSFSPAAPADGDTLTVSGTVTNRGGSTITGSHVGIRLGSGGDPLGNRSDLADAVRRGRYGPGDGAEVPGHTVDLADIPPGVSRPFTLRIPVDDLDLGGNGVYQLGVSLLGRTKAVPLPQILGIERTFLPWYPDPGKTEQTEITMAWPLVGRPHMDARTDSDAQQTSIFRDDDLTADLAPGGRLQQLVAIGRNLPVTWVIDPDLLATADAMAKGYRVAADDTVDTGAAGQEPPATGFAPGEGGPTRNTRPGTGTDLAKSWLYELRQATASSPVVALPFGDPDLASIAHQGKRVPGTLGYLKSATELASLTTETVLGVRPRTDVAWPVEGAVDRSIVNVARAGGADKVIASSTGLGPGSLNHTPNAVRPIGGGATALVADDRLSRAFRSDLSRAGDSTLAVQRFLAETLMVTMESPHRRRSLLVAPQRELTASAAQAMGKALSAGQRGGWITTAALGDTETAKPEAGADRTVPSPHDYPDRLRRQELTTSAFRKIQTTQTELEDFLVILSQQERVITPFGTAVLRSMSGSWRRDPAGARQYRDSLGGYLVGLKGLVHIVEKSPTTLSGNSGTLQVTVENNLAQKVTLRLRLTSALPYRFRIAPGQNQQTVTIEGERKKTLKFPTSATANGRVTVAAQLYTPDGLPYGEEMLFQVNVTSVTGTVLAVIACGMLLLVLAGARMYRQRRRVAPAADEAGAGPERPVEPAPSLDRRAADGVPDGGEAPVRRSGDGIPGAGEPAPERGQAPGTTAGAAQPVTTDEKVER